MLKKHKNIAFFALHCGAHTLICCRKPCVLKICCRMLNPLKKANLTLIDNLTKVSYNLLPVFRIRVRIY